MVYAAGVIIAGGRIAKFVDRTGRTRAALACGVVLTVAGVLFLSVIGRDEVLTHPNAWIILPGLVLVGVALIGVAHGLINATVLTHVTGVPLAHRIGAAPVSAIYRLLERGGHVLGPLLVGQLLLLTGPTPLALAWIGLSVLVLGLVFVLPFTVKLPRASKRHRRMRMREAAGPSIVAIGIAMLLLCASSSPAFAQMQTYTEWFRLRAQVSEDWIVEPSSADDLVVSIRPRHAPAGETPRHIIVLYPRASSAYDTAMTTFLDVIPDKRINAEFTVVNFQLDDARGKSALELAEESNFDLILSMGSENPRRGCGRLSGGKLPVVTVCSKDPVLLGQAAGLRRWQRHQLRLHVAQHADRRADVLRAASAAATEEPRHPSRCQQRERVQTQAARPQGTRGARHPGARCRGQDPRSQGEGGARQPRCATPSTRCADDVDPPLSNSLFWITGSTLLFERDRPPSMSTSGPSRSQRMTDMVRPGDVSAVLSVG